MTTSSFNGSENHNANSSASSSPNLNENLVVAEQMISLETKAATAASAPPPPPPQLNCIPTGLESDKSDLAVRLIDMSSSITMRNILPPTTMEPHLQQTAASDSVKAHCEPQWMTNSQLTSAGNIHRKSFNIDALLAKTQTTTTGDHQHPQERERFTPDSANDCYNEDRRDFTPSPR